MRTGGVFGAGFLAAAFAVAGTASAATVKVSYLHRLSNFSGAVPYSEVQLWVDRPRGEVYVAEGDLVRIYNATGMEIYEFQHDTALGTVLGLAVDEEGNIFVLSAAPQEDGLRPRIAFYDYRGRLRRTLSLRGLPASFEEFLPNAIQWWQGRLVLASTSQMKAALFDREGVFERGWDLAEWIGIRGPQRQGVELGGFGLDDRGNLLFTVPAQFKAYVASPDGQVKAFGKAGSVPGSFGVAAGIASTPEGFLLVADKLRNVVLIFDRDLRFVSEFGHRTGRPEGLVRPSGLATGDGGRVYVSQLGRQGVSAFTVTAEGGGHEP
jgi:hypothetical protein